MVAKLTAGLLAGFGSSVLAYLLLGWLFLRSPTLQDYFGPNGLLALWLLMLVIAQSASTAGKAWRYLLLLAGLFAFALPFVAFVAAGMRLDLQFTTRLHEIVVSVLDSSWLTANIGTGLLNFAQTWIPAADSQLLTLGWLAMGTLLLCLGLMIGNAPRGPIQRQIQDPLPGFVNVITAKGGTLKFRVLSYRPMSDDEVMTAVWDALEEGRLSEPSPNEVATLVTRIGLDNSEPQR